MKVFISPEWIHPVAKQTQKNNKLINFTINVNSQHVQHVEVGNPWRWRWAIIMWAMVVCVGGLCGGPMSRGTECDRTNWITAQRVLTAAYLRTVPRTDIAERAAVVVADAAINAIIRTSALSHRRRITTDFIIYTTSPHNAHTHSEPSRRQARIDRTLVRGARVYRISGSRTF